MATRRLAGGRVADRDQPGRRAGAARRRRRAGRRRARPRGLRRRAVPRPAGRLRIAARGRRARPRRPGSAACRPTRKTCPGRSSARRAKAQRTYAETLDTAEEQLRRATARAHRDRLVGRQALLREGRRPLGAQGPQRAPSDPQAKQSGAPAIARSPPPAASTSRATPSRSSTSAPSGPASRAARR